MLSETERRQLTAIESQLRVEDPDFVQRFNNGWEPQPLDRRRGLVSLAAVIVNMVIAGIGLALGSVATVVIAVTTIGAITGLWITHRRRPRA